MTTNFFSSLVAVVSNRSIHFAVLLAAFASLPSKGFAEIRVVTNFDEGGGTRIDHVDQETKAIRFAPGGDAKRGWPCWWMMRVEGLNANDKVTFELSPKTADGKKMALSSSWMMPAQASFSTDGKTWRHTERGQKQGDSMIYHATSEGSVLWLAWGPPFTPRDSQSLVDSAAKAAAGCEAFELCKSRDGRTVPALRVASGDLPIEKRFGVWVHARQHAWEAGSSWVCRGFVEWLTSDHADAVWLRNHAETIVVPIMDIDNTATGNGGKEAVPRDHNRDWVDEPHWAEVAAAQHQLKKWKSTGRLDYFVDLHNPGAGDSRAFFFVSPNDLLSDHGQRNRDRFLEIAKQNIGGAIGFDPKPHFSDSKYHPLWKQISGNWVSMNGNPHTVAVCLETSWNTPGSTTEGYRSIGQQLGTTIQSFLKTSPREYSNSLK